MELLRLGAQHRTAVRAQSRQAAILEDEGTGGSMANRKESGPYNRTLIYVTVDHGFDE